MPPHGDGEAIAANKGKRPIQAYLSMDFESFYIKWYSRVKGFAREYVLSEEEAENIAQDVFLELYQKKDTLDFHINIVAYLFTSVKNRCIDHLRRKLQEKRAVSMMQEEIELTFRMKYESLEAFDMEDLSEERIKQMVEHALSLLPERCREIFVLSKIQGKKQKEIAEELNISLKTVENQITIAYKKLREGLKNNFSFLLFFLPF